MSAENSPQIRVGLTETAHIALRKSHLFTPLSVRIKDTVRLGFDGYEPFPTYSTVLSALVFPLTEEARKRIINLHTTSWLADRMVYPLRTSTDSLSEYLYTRWLTSFVASSPILVGRAMSRLSSESPTASLHWPWVDGLRLSSREERMRRIMQKNTDKLVEHGARRILAERHVLLGLDEDNFTLWVEEGEEIGIPRGLAFVSGEDKRFEEYAGKQTLPLSDEVLSFTFGLYVKDGWKSQDLRSDLEKVLEARTVRDNLNEGLWIMVNTKSENEDTLSKQVDEIRGIVGVVLGGF